MIDDAVTDDAVTDDPATDDAASGQRPIVANGATELADVLAGADEQGFSGEFDVADDRGALRCPQCGATSDPATVSRAWSRRLEGASDPADMLHVSAVTCPQCGEGGVFISPYGPSASAGQAAALRALPEP